MVLTNTVSDSHAIGCSTIASGFELNFIWPSVNKLEVVVSFSLNLYLILRCYFLGFNLKAWI